MSHDYDVAQKVGTLTRGRLMSGDEILSRRRSTDVAFQKLEKLTTAMVSTSGKATKATKRSRRKWRRVIEKAGVGAVADYHERLRVLATMRLKGRLV